MSSFNKVKVMLNLWHKMFKGTYFNFNKLLINTNTTEYIIKFIGFFLTINTNAFKLI